MNTIAPLLTPNVSRQVRREHGHRGRLEFVETVQDQEDRERVDPSPLETVA